MELRTLCLTRPFGRTIWLTLILLPLLAGAAEGVARLDFLQARLTAPKMGSRHYQLGNKLALLDDLITRSGPVDCLVVGSSMVDLGFDPEAFKRGYKQETGRDLQCFNFGIDASSAVSTAALARILVEDYRPRLLIFGTDPRDYAIPGDDPDPTVILETSWVRYRDGDFSLDGWLLEHFYLYRYRQHFARLMRLNFRDTLRSETRSRFEILPNGFTPVPTVSTYINDPPDPGDDSFEVTYYSRIFSSFRMFEDNLAALEEIMVQNGPGTQVVIVEMPVADGLFYFFGNGKEDYFKFLEQLEESSEAKGVLFFSTEPLDLIPDDGWADYSHVNTQGAALFSAWLGQQVGEEVNQGAIRITAR